MYVLPTGGGKTYTFSFLAQGIAKQGGRVLILEHRNELVLQASESLNSLGVAHGLITPQHRPHYQLPVQVASVATLARRLHKPSLTFQPTFIIIDEAHHAVAGTWQTILDAFQPAQLLGVTATPIREDKKPLTNIFDDLVIGATAAELMALGNLCRYDVFASSKVLDYSGIRSKGHDFNPNDLFDFINANAITGDAVQAYIQHAAWTPTLVFCVSIAHATTTCEAFNNAGFKFAILTGKQDYYTRKRLIHALATGELNGLVSVEVISEGTDIPVATTAIFLRPTQSKGLHLQQFGRVLRPAQGKERALILDHVGNTLRHGVPDMEHDWHTSFWGEPPKPPKPKEDKEEKYKAAKQCPQCFFVFIEGIVCPHCGFTLPTQCRTVEEHEGELVKLDDWHLRKAIEQANTMQDFMTIAKKQGYKPGWAYHQVKLKKDAEQYQQTMNYGGLSL